MKNVRTAGLLALFLVVGVGIAALVDFFPAEAETEGREFWTEPDPGFVLIDLRYKGMLGSTRHRLYADGRLLTEKLGRSDSPEPGEVLAAEEHQVSLEEMNALLSDVVDAGLMEYDREAVYEKMGPKRRTIHVSDGGSMSLEIALQHYRGPGMRKARSAEVLIGFDNPGILAPYFPDVEELQCLRRVGEWFRKHAITPKRGQK